MKVPKGYILVLEKDWIKLQQQLKDLFLIVEMQQARISELEQQLKKNSSNSDKPPSTDVFHKPIHNNREKSLNKQGGQPGHKGSNLKMAEKPDRIVTRRVEGKCNCGRDLSRQELIGIHYRQVFDLPEKLIEVTEYQIEERQCKCGKCFVGDDLNTAQVRYGNRIKALAVYMNNYGFIPYDRLQDFFYDCFDLTIGDGTLLDTNQQCYTNLEETERLIKEYLKSSPVNHHDESGLRCESGLKWVHDTSNKRFTHYAIHPKRGKAAIDEIGILPDFKGIIVHDRYSSYDSYKQCDHSLCNAHLLRELKALVESGKEWASLMIALLLEAKNIKETTIPNSKIIKDIFSKCDKIISVGLENEPEPVEGKTSKRGRKKKSDSLRLLEAFSTRKDQIFKFLTHPLVPFDNNLAERDLRMVKLKQKISGCFRTFKGAEIFLRIRSYISTSRKQGVNILDSLQLAIEGRPVSFGN